MTATWLGQVDQDLVGVGPNVGPDGIVDAQITLSGLAAAKNVSAINVTISQGPSWAYGLNPQSVNIAELVRSSADASQGTLSISPLSGVSLTGVQLAIGIVYSDGATDSTTVVAGAVNASLKVPPPPSIVFNSHPISVNWLGQDGFNLAGTGSVHLTVSSLPAGRTIVGGMLSDSTFYSWGFGSIGGVSATAIDPSAGNFVFQLSGDGKLADLGFLPRRDLSGSNMTLRLVLDDGSSLLANFQGQETNAGLQLPALAATTFYAKPGDNIHSIVNNYGTVYLAAGTYTLTDPLILNKPVNIVGQPGAVLLFSQPENSYAWTTAIKIHASNTTLQGFAVRFAGAVEWAPNISYGPAVIGATDNYDVGFYDPLYNLSFTNLDLQAPPASSDWEEAVRLIRLAGATSGDISGNKLKGGPIEFFNGPWSINDNTYVGTMPNTFSYGVIVGHYVYDVEITGNSIDGGAANSKTWRFLVLTQSGANVVVADNTVVNVGPRDNDTVPNPNAPETILTESYRLHFEGTPSAISSDGLVLQIPFVQFDSVRTGDIVAILSGPDAGQWRTVRQALSSTAFLLDRKIDPSSTAVSISSGFANLQFTGNRIDSRGSSVVDGIALVGNVFGTTVSGNEIIGGKDAVWVDAAPTEIPNIWGWSHAPVMGLVLRDNLFIDTIDGGVIDVDHGIWMKTNIGRLYFSGSITGNLVIWTQAFLDAVAAKNLTAKAYSIGNKLSIDPGEMELTLANNVYLTPANQSKIPAFLVASSTMNGTEYFNQIVAMLGGTSAISGLRLVNDDGSSTTDRSTSDGRLTLQLLSPLLSYEYSLTGQNGVYLPINLSADGSFLPAGLVEGQNTIHVRAVSPFGAAGDVASLTFELTTRPAAPGGLRVTNDTGTSATDGITADARVTFTVVAGAVRYEYSLSGANQSWSPVVLSNGGFLPMGLVQGTNFIQVRAVNSAGAAGPASTLRLVLDTTPPALPSIQLLNDTGMSASDGVTSDARLTLWPSSGASFYQYAVGSPAGPYWSVNFLSGSTFLPMGLDQGLNRIYARAVDAAGNVSGIVSLSFTLDTTPPASVPVVSVKPNGTVTVAPTESGLVYEYRLSTSSSFIPLGAGTSFKISSGTRRAVTAFIRAIDRAGNVGPETRFNAPAASSVAVGRLRRLTARPAALMFRYLAR